MSEVCEEVVVFFKDYRTNQLYTIAFAEDDDFEENARQSIRQLQKRIADLQAKEASVGDVRKEKRKLAGIEAEFRMDKQLRDQVLTMNQRI